MQANVGQDKLPVFQAPPAKGQPIAERSRVYLHIRPRGSSDRAKEVYRSEIRRARVLHDIRWDTNKRMWYVSRAADFSAMPEAWLGPICYENYNASVHVNNYTGLLEEADGRNRW